MFQGNATSVSLKVMIFKVCDRELTRLSKFISLKSILMLQKEQKNVQRAPHTRLGHATEVISHKIGTRVERTLACFKRAPNAFEAYSTRL